jgi:hypothetical protein
MNRSKVNAVRYSPNTFGQNFYMRLTITKTGVLVCEMIFTYQYECQHLSARN